VACSPGGAVVLFRDIGGQLQEGAVRVLVSMNFGGSRTSQMLEELVLQFSAFHFCSLEGGGKKGDEEKQLSSGCASIY
jgi:hypothetical protein